MDVAAVASPLGVEWDQLEIAQRLQAVPQAIGGGVHGHHPQLLPARLGVEEEEEPIQPHEALALELLRVELLLQLTVPFPLVDAVAPDVLPVVDDLIGEQLDGLADPLLQVRGDREGVLVRLLVQRVVQAAARVGREHVAV